MDSRAKSDSWVTLQIKFYQDITKRICVCICTTTTQSRSEWWQRLSGPQRLKYLPFGPLQNVTGAHCYFLGWAFDSDLQSFSARHCLVKDFGKVLLYLITPIFYDVLSSNEYRQEPPGWLRPEWHCAREIKTFCWNHSVEKKAWHRYMLAS